MAVTITVAVTVTIAITSADITPNQLTYNVPVGVQKPAPLTAFCHLPRLAHLLTSLSGKRYCPTCRTCPACPSSPSPQLPLPEAPGHSRNGPLAHLPHGRKEQGQVRQVGPASTNVAVGGPINTRKKNSSGAGPLWSSQSQTSWEGKVAFSPPYKGY